MSALNMSLFYFLSHSFTLWPDAYECPDDLKRRGTKWPIFGLVLFVTGVLFLILYIPCLVAIIQLKKSTPAFKLMLVLAILNISELVINSLITGVWAYHGTSFCQSPKFFFIVSAMSMGTWMTGCLASVLLAIERCVEVAPNHPLEILFERNVFFLVQWSLFLYFVYSVFFNKPIIYNPDYASFFFDPMIRKDPELYHSYPHTINNIFVAISTTTLHFYLCYYLIFKFGYSTSMWLYKSKRQIILQGVVLCFFHATVALVYEYMQYFSSPQWLKLLGQLLWQWNSGCLSVVYLTLNRTIRNSVFKLVIPKRIREQLGLHIGVEEHLALEQVGGINAISSHGNNVQVNNFFI